MGIRDRLETLRQKALQGLSAFAAPPSAAPSLGDRQVEDRLHAIGGQLSPLPTTRLRWYLADLESAQHAADCGDMSLAAQLVSACLGDGFLRGVLSARMSGVTALPRVFHGDEEQIAALTFRDGARAVFDDMFPPQELAALSTDGLLLGVGVAQMVPVPGRDFPVLVRLEPEFLRYRWVENRWYYVSTAGLLPITPGDGRWILHIEGGRVSPWRYGLWRAIGGAWIDKVHARLHESNWEAKLANPARVAFAPVAASEAQRQGMLQRLIAWGVNTVFELPVGWDAKILESNGRGSESFVETISRSNIEYMISILGQMGTTTSAGAFASSDVHEAVRADLIGATAKALAHTINTQGIPPWAFSIWGEAGLVRAAVLEYDTTPPAGLVSRANGMQAMGTALVSANQVLATEGKRIDAAAEYRRFGVAVVDLAPATPAAANDAPKADEKRLEADDVELHAAAVEDVLEAEPEPDPIADLAEKMTEHGVPRCEHGNANRCRICGIERVRDFEPGPDGVLSWHVRWQPIREEAA
jgi:hypothetical protein